MLPRTLQHALSEGLREVRLRAGYTQGELGQRLRGYGLTGWNSNTVAHIESGRRRLSLEQLLLVAVALDLAPADLVLGDEPIGLAANARVSADDVRELLSGRLDPNAAPVGMDIPLTQAMSRAWEKAKSLEQEIGPILEAPDITMGEFRARMVRAAESVDDSVRKAARALGVEPIVVAAAAQRLYGRPFSEERDARIAVESSAAALPTRRARRGHASRRLIAEIGAQLAKLNSPREQH